MNRTLVLAAWQRAGQALRAAEVLTDAGYSADALSRAYYATLHAAKERSRCTMWSRRVMRRCDAVRHVSAPASFLTVFSIICSRKTLLLANSALSEYQFLAIRCQMSWSTAEVEDILPTESPPNRSAAD